MNRHEFRAALNFAGIFLSSPELTAVFKVYADDKRLDCASYIKFLEALRIPLNARRLYIVRVAWEYVIHSTWQDRYTSVDGIDMDTHPLDVDKLWRAADIAACTDVRTGALLAEDLQQHMQEGMLAGSSAAAASAGAIDYAGFKTYYTDIGACIPDDDYFVKNVCAVWHVSESGKDEQREELIQHFLEILRTKVDQKSTGLALPVHTLRKAFAYFDDEGDGSVNKQAFRQVLAQMGLPLSLSQIDMLYNHFPHAQNGNVDYLEFVNIVYTGVVM